MTCFGILCILFVIDGLTTHYIVSKGGKEVGLIVARIFGSKPTARDLIVYTIIKCVLFGIVFALTEGMDALHQGLIIGAAVIVAWNISQVIRALRDR